MTSSRIIAVAFALTLVAGLAMFTTGPTSAMPGWSSDGHPALSMSQKQRDQIRNLHSAYRAALSNLDWSVGENGHRPETMRQARELRIALRAEIMDVLSRGTPSPSEAPEGSCPYGGKARPIRVGSEDTLYL